MSLVDRRIRRGRRHALWRVDVMEDGKVLRCGRHQQASPPAPQIFLGPAHFSLGAKGHPKQGCWVLPGPGNVPCLMIAAPCGPCV